MNTPFTPAELRQRAARQLGFTSDSVRSSATTGAVNTERTGDATCRPMESTPVSNAAPTFKPEARHVPETHNDSTQSGFPAETSHVEIRITKRGVILSDSEIATDYNAQTSPESFMKIGDDVERHGEAESYSDWIRNRDRIQNERDAEEHKWNQYENREN